MAQPVVRYLANALTGGSGKTSATGRVVLDVEARAKVAEPGMEDRARERLSCARSQSYSTVGASDRSAT